MLKIFFSFMACRGLQMKADGKYVLPSSISKKCLTVDAAGVRLSRSLPFNHFTIFYLKKIVFSYCISYVACEPSLTRITVMLQNINKCKNNWMNKQMFAHIQTLPCDCTCTQVPVLVMRKGGVNWFSSTSSITQKLVKVTEPGLQYGGFVFLSSLTLWNSWTDPALQFLG